MTGAHGAYLAMQSLTLDPWPAFGATVLAALLGALVLHAVVYGVLHRIRHRTPSRLPLGGHLVVRTDAPMRWVLGLVALRAAWAALPSDASAAWSVVGDHVLYVLLVVAIAWLALRSVGAVNLALRERLDLDKDDNLSERKLITQVGLTQRIINVGIVLIALAAIFLHFESFRRIGTGLLASAGVAGIVLGIAAQRVLGNVLAGIQIAITQPIRVDDVVVVEGEWARVEEITLTYVVVRIWDLRRLILPISYFIETPFQNWTRSSARVIGAVTLHTDYAVPVEAVRTEVGRIVEASQYFDGDMWKLHVTDLGPQGVEMRVIATALNADHAWELRAELRERLVGWLQANHPESLPRTRVVFPERPRTDSNGRTPELARASPANPGG